MTGNAAQNFDGYLATFKPGTDPCVALSVLQEVFSNHANGGKIVDYTDKYFAQFVLETEDEPTLDEVMALDDVFYVEKVAVRENKLLPRRN